MELVFWLYVLILNQYNPARYCGLPPFNLCSIVSSKPRNSAMSATSHSVRCFTVHTFVFNSLVSLGRHLQRILSSYYTVQSTPTRPTCVWFFICSISRIADNTIINKCLCFFIIRFKWLNSQENWILTMRCAYISNTVYLKFIISCLNEPCASFFYPNIKLCFIMKSEKCKTVCAFLIDLFHL